MNVHPLNTDPYNRRRYKILYAIDYLTKLKCTPNSSSVARVSGIDKATVSKAVNRMAGGEIILKIDPLNMHGCIYKYSLSLKGKRILGGYNARCKSGYDLRLRNKNPAKVDYSDFVLLPGLKEQHDIQFEY